MTKRLAVSKPIDGAAKAGTNQGDTRAFGVGLWLALWVAGLHIRPQEWVLDILETAEEESDD